MRFSIFPAAAVLVLTGGLLTAGGEARAGERAWAAPELATVCVNESCGYVDARGEWRIPPQFRAADPFGPDGLAQVIIQETTRDGKPVYGGGFSQTTGVASYAGMPYGGKIGLIDAQGELVGLSPYLGFVRAFGAGGLAAAKENTGWARPEQWGFINRQGQWVIRPHDFITSRDQWLIQPREIIDRLGGRMRLQPRNHIEAQGGQWAVKPGGFIDEPGRRLVESWDFIDRHGLPWVIQPRIFFDDPNHIGNIRTHFEFAWNFSEQGLAQVRKDGLWGLINLQGEWVIPPEFSSIGGFDADGLTLAVAGQESGLINSQGQWIIEPGRFQEFGHFNAQGLAKVRAGRLYGLINRLGQMVAEPQFENMHNNFSKCGLVGVKKRGNGVTSTLRPTGPLSRDSIPSMSSSAARPRLKWAVNGG